MNLNAYKNTYLECNFCILESILSEEPDSYKYKSSCILDTNWNDVNEYHLKWYTPSNCRIFLYGNIPTEKQLLVLNENVFSSAENEQEALYDKKKDDFKKVKKWKEPKSNKISIPGNKNPAIAVSWYCGDLTNIKYYFDYKLLKEILTEKENSDFFKEINSYAIIINIFSLPGGEYRSRELIFNLTAEIDIDYKESDTEESIEEYYLAALDIIYKELKRLCRTGISRETLKRIIYKMEFENKIIRKGDGGYPFSYNLMGRSLEAWQFNKKPWESLVFDKPFADFKKRINKRYVKNLIRKYLLNNSHYLFTIIEPDTDIKEISITERLEKMRKNMTLKEKEIIQEKAQELKEYQNKEDDPRHTAKIPHISLNEIDPNISFIKREYADINGAPVIINPILNNCISNIHIAFPVDTLDPETYLGLPLFTRAIRKSGVPGLSPEEIDHLLKRNIGCFEVDLEILPSLQINFNPDIQGREWIVFSIITLDENIGPALHLANMIIKEADFSGLENMHKLIPDLDIEMECSNYANSFSGYHNSRSIGITEIWGGMNQYIFQKNIEHKFLSEENEKEINAFISEMRDIFYNYREVIINSGAIINITGNNINKTIKELKNHFGWLSAPKPCNPEIKNWNNYNLALETKYSYPLPDVFLCDDLRSGTCAVPFRASPAGSILHPVERVLSNLLETGSFYENLRLKGGVYIVQTRLNNLLGGFSIITDRDPDPLRSLEFITGFFKNASAESIIKDKSVLEKAIIGTIAEYTPCTPSSMGYTDFCDYLTGIENKDRLKRRREILTVTPKLLDEAIKRFSSQLEDSVNPIHPVIIAEKNIAKQIRKKTGIRYREFWKIEK
ncbi:MAG: insulinase family protein [Treponema sp.]|nr:insulinase family protein [Treponema sp.]